MKEKEPNNLEEQAISLVGYDIYEKLIKGYTEKQWGRDCKNLPAFIIRRLPVRYTFDNNYFNDLYQGVPHGGYNTVINNMLKECEIKLGVDYLAKKDDFDNIANKILFTGMIDEYFNFRFGKLEYRTVSFETEILPETNYQGNAVINFTDRDIPYTRIIEHKHFEFGEQAHTVISREYSTEWKEGAEPYYPVNDLKNNELFAKYEKLSKKEKNVIFGGRLAQYKYFDMHNIIEQVLKMKNEI